MKTTSGGEGAHALHRLLCQLLSLNNLFRLTADFQRDLAILSLRRDAGTRPLSHHMCPSGVTANLLCDIGRKIESDCLLVEPLRSTATSSNTSLHCLCRCSSHSDGCSVRNLAKQSCQRIRPRWRRRHRHHCLDNLLHQHLSSGHSLCGACNSANARIAALVDVDLGPTRHLDFIDLLPPRTDQPPSASRRHLHGERSITEAGTIPSFKNLRYKGLGQRDCFGRSSKSCQMRFDRPIDIDLRTTFFLELLSDRRSTWCC